MPYRRSLDTLFASWAEIARGARGAALRRLPGVTAAVFPHGPERAFYNNAVLADAAAIARMEAAYGDIPFAAWVHETDAPLRNAVEARGYALSETTRAMAMELDAPVAVPDAPAELVPLTWPEYRVGAGLPAGLLAGTDPAAFHALGARLDGAVVATAIAYDHGGDCVVANVGTEPAARRRGIATALTARLLADARARGCTTASLQATPMAERVYAAAGFRDLGRILEFTRA